MSSDVANVYIGAQANDGTGDPIRTAFDSVNKNFYNIDTRISTGNIAQVYATVTLTGQNLVSNTSTTTQTLHVAQTALVDGTLATGDLIVDNTFNANTITSSGNVNVGGWINAAKDVVINGNLTVVGNTTTISSVNTSISESLMHLHTQANSAPWTLDDGKDIGFTFNYFKTSNKIAALVLANDSQSLEFYSDGTETAGNTFVGTYGNIKAGNFISTGVIADTIAANTTVSTSIASNVLTTANLTVTNKIVGDLYIGGPGSSDNIYVNGVPVATSISAFNGGPVNNLAWFLNGITANSAVASTSTSTGALTVVGGVGITGNIYAGGIVDTPISGSSGDFTTLSVATSFAATNVSFNTGYLTNVHGDATQWSITDLVTGNANITGGTVTGLISLGAANATITSGTITGLTNLSTSAATITSGSLTGLSQVTTTNLTAANGILINSPGGRISGDFSNLIPANRVLFQTTTTNGPTNISAMPRGTIATTGLTGSFRIEDTNAIAISNGASAGIELYQDTDFRINSSIRGGGTYLPVTVYTSGTKNAQFSVNHDFTIFNTGGAGVILLGANGSVSATSFTGDGSALTNVNALTAASAVKLQTARLLNGVPFDGTADISIPSSGTVAAANLTGSTLSANVTLSSLTSVGTLSSITTSGTISATSNGTQNIGSVSNKFGTIYGLATSAQYADLAEIYESDSDYEPGTIVVFGGDKEITISSRDHDTSVAGVVSTNPAYLMNHSAHGIPVALKGRVPCKVIGPIRKGDVLVTSAHAGIARAMDNVIGSRTPGCIIGKALSAVEGNQITMIEVVVL